MTCTAKIISTGSGGVLPTQLLHGGVLDVAGTEAEDGQEHPGLALVLDEADELAPARYTHVEITVGGQDDSIDAALHESFGGDLVC